jgi:hypothetical protein
MLYSDLHALNVPDNANDHFTHSTFTAMVNCVQAQPLDMTAPMQCIVCGANHRFDNCAVLQNMEFLKSHYICFCQQLHCNACEWATSLQGSTSLLSVPPPSSVNFIDAQDAPPDDIEHVDDDTSSEVDEDFQTGCH